MRIENWYLIIGSGLKRIASLRVFLETQGKIEEKKIYEIQYKEKRNQPFDTMTRIDMYLWINPVQSD